MKCINLKKSFHKDAEIVVNFFCTFKGSVAEFFYIAWSYTLFPVCKTTGLAQLQRWKPKSPINNNNMWEGQQFLGSMTSFDKLFWKPNKFPA